MSSRIAQKLGRHLFASHATALEPRDPLYETAIDPRTGKQKRKRRGLPAGLSKSEEKILKKIRRRAYYLDKGFSLCGFRFGWTAIIGLIPVAGDVADATLSYMLIIRPARQCDLPPMLIQRMLFNQALATSIGLVPLVGDLLMAVWKVNSRNAALFEDFLIVRGQHLVASAPGQQASPVTLTETTRLVENSTQPDYVDGMTGERQPVAGPSVAEPADGTAVGSTADSTPAVGGDKKKTRKGWFWK